jgi:3-isopropylmalate/(R)-2-methylmalate dehydratase small subunit
VSTEFLEKIFNNIYENPKTKLNIDLNQQIIRILGTDSSESFEINEYKKGNMLNGYDDIDYLMNIKDSIEKFAKKTPL